ncbi:MAG: hypothetical protein V4687_04605 [Bacteroidota bacterium]
MKTLKVIMALMSIVMLIRCSALKKTTSVKTEEEIKAKKEMEMQQIKLKTASKETNVVTYNPDGTVYQRANIKEQIDQSKMAKLKVDENVSAKTGIVEKVATPQGFWITLIAGLVIIGIVFFLLRFTK